MSIMFSVYAFEITEFVVSVILVVEDVGNITAIFCLF